MEKKQNTLAAKLAAISTDAGNVAKAQPQGARFKYRSYDDVLTALRPHLSEAGVIIIPKLESKALERIDVGGGRTAVQASVEFSYIITDGEGEINASFAGMAVDYGDKALTQACTMCHKYFLVQIFNLAGSLEDPDQQNTEVPTPAPAPKVQIPSAKNELPTIPDEKFSFEALEKAGWDGSMNEDGQILLLNKKNVKVLYQLSPIQVVAIKRRVQPVTA